MRIDEEAAEIIGHNKKARLTEVKIGVRVDERVIAYFDFGLILELLGCRLVIRGMIGSEIPNVSAKLESQNAHGANNDVGVGVKCQSGQWDNVIVAGSLINNLVIPSEGTVTEVLAKSCCDNLEATGVLGRPTVSSEVDIVRDILHTGRNTRTRLLPLGRTAYIETLRVAQIIVPHEVSTVKVALEEGGTEISECTLCTD